MLAPHEPPDDPRSPQHPPNVVDYLPAHLKTGLAVSTLVLGILGLVMCPLVGMAAVVTDIVALNRISREPQVHGGKGMAIAGLTCGAVSLACMTPLMISILLPSLARARELSKRLVCGTNLKAIGAALHTYSTDFAGQGVPTVDDLVRVGLLTDTESRCLNKDERNYVILRHPLPPEDTGFRVIAYEPKSNHGDEGGNILFHDGSVRFLKRGEYEAVVSGLSPRGP